MRKFCVWSPVFCAFHRIASPQVWCPRWWTLKSGYWTEGIPDRQCCACPLVQGKSSVVTFWRFRASPCIPSTGGEQTHTHMARAHTHVCTVLALAGGDVFLFILLSNNINPRAFEFKDRFPALKKDTTQRVECASPFSTTIVRKWGLGSTAWCESGVGARRPPRWRTCWYGRTRPVLKRPAET